MRIGMLGSGLIAMFYTMALHGKRGRDQVTMVCSRTKGSADKFAKQWNIPDSTTEMAKVIESDQVDVVVVALPNHQHKQAVLAAAAAGKPVLCTKPLGRTY